MARRDAYIYTQPPYIISVGLFRPVKYLAGEQTVLACLISDLLHTKMTGSPPIGDCYYLCNHDKPVSWVASVENMIVKCSENLSWYYTPEDETIGNPRVLGLHDKQVTGLCFANSKTVATSSDCNAYIWSIYPYRRQQSAYRLKGHRFDVTSLSSNLDNQLCTGSMDGSLRIWNLNEITNKSQLLGRCIEKINCCLWRFGSVSTGGNTKLRNWDVKLGCIANEFEMMGGVSCIDQSLNVIAAGVGYSGNFVLQDIRALVPAAQIQGYGGQIKTIKWHGDGNSFVTGGGNAVKLWDSRILKEPYQVDCSFGGVECVDWYKKNMIVAGDSSSFQVARPLSIRP